MREEADAFQARAIERHDLDSGVFQGRYINLAQGKYTDPFIYGRCLLLHDLRDILSSLPAGSKVLDVGCGTGHFCRSIQLAGHQPTGLEPSAKMLALARGNFPDLEFVEGLSTALPFSDQTFDLVISIEVLRYLHPQDVAVSYHEMHRVLRPQGILFATQVNRWSSDAYLLYYHLVRLFKWCLHQSYHHCYFTDPLREERMLKRTGFQSVQVWGRMWGLLRIGYKAGPGPGRALARLLEWWDPVQRWYRGAGRWQAGHLVVTARKAANETGTPHEVRVLAG